jgi:16S rRNA (guanine966-N2)-methyltransferase
VSPGPSRGSLLGEKALEQPVAMKRMRAIWGDCFPFITLSIGRPPNSLREIEVDLYFFSMRITGGEYRSRTLRAPRGASTRPSSDRVREALFGILASSDVAVAGARVLDVYAGTGALALEALSRGAAYAVLVERGKEALAAIHANVSVLGCASRVEVVAAPAERAAKLVRGRFDLVFADPPYADVDNGSALGALASLVASGVLAPEATVVLEHAARAARKVTGAPEIAGLFRYDSRYYGDTALSFYSLGHSPR